MGPSEFVDVLKEVQYLTGKLRKDTDHAQLCNDGKFAARVIDRRCLWMFFICALISTGAILLSAPHATV